MGRVREGRLWKERAWGEVRPGIVRDGKRVRSLEFGKVREQVHFKVWKRNGREGTIRKWENLMERGKEWGEEGRNGSANGTITAKKKKEKRKTKNKKKKNIQCNLGSKKILPRKIKWIYELCENF